MESRVSHLVRRAALLAALLGSVWPAASPGQAPFLTDDTAVSEARTWHFELFGIQADLAPRDLPARARTTLVASAAFGLFGWLEVGLDSPWIAVDQVGASDLEGIGDLKLRLKARLREFDGGVRPGLALLAVVESPTGDEGEGLGSGVFGLGLGLAAEWWLGPSTALRANAGILFAGDERTGVVGIQGDGEIATGGLSLTRTFRRGWEAGLELWAAEGRGSASGERDFVTQLGVRRRLTERVTLAAGAFRGWEIAPDWQLQAGLIVDP